MKSSDSCRSTPTKDELHHTMYLPDIPLPTPPPMANIMVTSRFDLPTRGGFGYRRILSSRSTEFRSPVLTRSNLSHNQIYRSPLTTRRFGSEKDAASSSSMRSDTLPLRKSVPPQDCLSPVSRRRQDYQSPPSENPCISPLYRNQNFEDLSRIAGPQNFRRISENDFDISTVQCLSVDSVFSHENEEVDSISSEIRNRTSESYSNDISPDYQNVYYNEHYISDIDENEEIKEFACGYNAPERRYSDHSDTKKSPSFKYFGYNTLPSKHYSFPIDTRRSYGSNSSMKSSDYNQYAPQKNHRKSLESLNVFGNAVVKSPYRPIVKIAKIR